MTRARDTGTRHAGRMRFLAGLKLSLVAMAVGALAGVGTWGVDFALVAVSLGHVEPLWRLGFILAYAGVGALGATTAAAWGLLGSRRVGRLEAAAWGVAVIFAVPVFERAHDLVTPRLAGLPAVVVASLVCAAYGGWVLFLRWAAGHRAPWVGVLLGGLTAAVALAVNRNLVAEPLAPAALGLDLVFLATALGLALVHRQGRARWTAAGSLTAVLLVVGIGTWLEPVRASDTALHKGRERANRDAANLVLIVVDTLRHDVFEAVVAETVEGRRFEAAFDAAAWFSNAIAAAPWTLPSMGSIMTGHYPPEHGMQRSAGHGLGMGLTSEVPTLAQSLARRGYATTAIVTNLVLLPQTGIQRGFDDYRLLRGGTLQMPFLTAVEKLGFLGQDYFPGSSVHRQLVKVLPRLSREQPFFLWLHLMDPHVPLRSHPLLAADPGARDLPRSERLYRNEVRYALSEVAGMMERLRSLPGWERTAVVFVSDHGEMFPSDGHQGVDKDLELRTEGHGHALYDELLRVPLIIRPPGGLDGRRQVDVLTSHVDLYDTLLDLLAIDAPRIGGDRISVAPYLAPPSPSRPMEARRHTLMALGPRGDSPEERALTTGTLKVIDGAVGSGELYDLRTDPGEANNLAAKRPAELERLLQLLHQSWSELKPAAKTQPIRYDEKTRQRLRALGYVE